MDHIKKVFVAYDIEDLGIKLSSEKTRQNLMLVLCALILYSFPFYPSKSPMYCVHNCLWDMRPNEVGRWKWTEQISSETMRCQARDSVVAQWTSEGTDGHVITERSEVTCLSGNRKKCKNCPMLDEQYCQKSQSVLVNTLCPLKKIYKQMLFSCVSLAIGIAYSWLQNAWVFLTEKSLCDLIDIKKELKGAKVCDKCILNFVKTGQKKLCPSCSKTNGIEKTEAMEDMENEQKNITSIETMYLIQCTLNALIAAGLLYVRFHIKAHTPWFQCDLGPTFIALKNGTSANFRGLDDILNSQTMHCLDPDSEMAWFVVWAIAFLLVMIFVFFICKAFKYRSVVKELYHGIGRKDQQLQ